MKQQPSYQEFEPYCKWRKEQQHDILEIHVQGFKKEQLKATMNRTLGVLKIIGELSLDEYRRIRFRKEINVSKVYKTDEINAKFSNGIIYITMPKIIPSDSTQAAIQKNGDKQTDLPANGFPTLEMSGQTALKLGALATVLAVGAYVVYKIRQA